LRWHKETEQVTDGDCAGLPSQDLHGLYSFISCEDLLPSPELDHTQAVGAANTAEFNRVHRLPHEMQSQSTGSDLVQASRAKLRRVDGKTLVPEQDFKSRAGLSGKAPEPDADGPV